MEQKNIPVLRFPEFEGEWEKKKLGEISTTFSGGTPLTSIRAYFEGDIPFIKSGEIDSGQTEQYISEDAIRNSSAKRVNKGDLLYALYGATSGEVAISKIDGAINQAVLCVRTSLSTYFAYTFLVNNKSSIIRKFLQGGQGNLSAEIVKSINVNFPTLPEQQKIASFFTAIDQKISQLKKKHQLLEQYKKGVMQQIFSQQIRFKDDDGREFPRWEKKRLDEVISKFIVPMRDKPTDLTGDIPWCRIEDFNGKYLFESKSNQGVSKETVRIMNLKIYPINTLIVSCSANLGFCAIVKKELVTNQTFIGLVPKTHAINVEYLYYVMILSAIKLNTLSSGTTISYLSREQFEKFNIFIPTLPEQGKIANFLSAIDNKIQHIQKQIDHAEVWKKGLMQQMFV